MSVPGGGVQRQIAGRYRVDGPLGSGAMGTVWSGFDDVLQRRVAIKELKFPEGIPSGEELELRERIMREARALAGLSHPNVVTVFDVLDAEGDPLVVMELVPSRNLATAITELGRLDRSQAAVVGYGTSAALRAAHRAGITHRDVKPGNVLISDDGRIKLTDFGIARNESDAPMTSAGLVLGSPAYIAPEVAAGQPVTPAADLWGLGATLFAAVEGRPPYDVDGDPVRTLTEVVDGNVPRVSEPGPLADVIAGLMVKEPSGRMPLDEVRSRLSPMLADPSDPIFPGSPDVPTVMARLHPDGSPAPIDSSGPSRGRATRSLLRGRAVESSAPPMPMPTSAPETSGGTRSSGGYGAPLSADPGPMPSFAGPAPAPVNPGTGRAPARPAPPPVRPSRPAPQAAAPSSNRRIGVLDGIPLVLGGALIVLFGAVGGYAGVRAVAGQEPLSTVTATTARVPLIPHPDPLGFSVGVPETWTRSQYRYDNGGRTTVRFVSPDGSEELSIRSAGSAREVTDNLSAAALGVDSASTEQVYQDATDGSQQLVVRTTDAPQTRSTWLRIVPGRDGGVWVVSLTVPGDRSDAMSDDLFRTLADGFRVTG